MEAVGRRGGWPCRLCVCACVRACAQEEGGRLSAGAGLWQNQVRTVRCSLRRIS